MVGLYLLQLQWVHAKIVLERQEIHQEEREILFKAETAPVMLFPQE
jgi:hypothetical protein